MLTISFSVEIGRSEVLAIGIYSVPFSDVFDPSMYNIYFLEPDNNVWTYCPKTDENPTGLSTNITEKELLGKKVLYRFQDLTKYYKFSNEIKEKYAKIKFDSETSNGYIMLKDLIDLYKNEENSKTRKAINPKYRPLELNQDQLDAIKKLDTRIY